MWRKAPVRKAVWVHGQLLPLFLTYTSLKCNLCVSLGRSLTLPFFSGRQIKSYFALEMSDSLPLCVRLSFSPCWGQNTLFFIFQALKSKGVKRHERPPSRQSSAALCLNSSTVTVWQFLLAFTSLYYHGTPKGTVHTDMIKCGGTKKEQRIVVVPDSKGLSQLLITNTCWETMNWSVCKRLQIIS